MTGADRLVSLAHGAAGADHGAPTWCMRTRGAGAAPGGRADRPRASTPASWSDWPAWRATARRRFSTRWPGRRRPGRSRPCTTVEETIVDSAWRAAEQGIRYLPRERRAEALFAGMSVRENFALPTMGQRHGVRASCGRRGQRAGCASTPAARHRLRRPRSDDPDTLGRQPAEGHHLPRCWRPTRGCCCSTTPPAGSTWAPSAISTRCSRSWSAAAWPSSCSPARSTSTSS